MRACCGPQAVPPTEKAAKYVLIIKFLTVLQLLIAILDIVAGDAFLREGLFGLVFLFLLFNAYYRLSYASIIIYTFASIFFAVIFLTYILTILQRGARPEDLQTAWSQYYMAVAAASFLFYAFNTIFMFYPYREFKSVEYSENPAFNQFMMQTEKPLEDPKELKKIDIDYGTEEPNKAKKPKGAFEVFRGQGVRIG